MISVETLEKRYDELVAATDVRFEIAKGEIVGLLGQNGAGKTTVMKMITGYLEPTAGTVKVGGIDVREDRLGVQRQIGYMPESAPLYREMLVQEYLLMLAELRGIPATASVCGCRCHSCHGFGESSHSGHRNASRVTVSALDLHRLSSTSRKYCSRRANKWIGSYPDR